MGVVGEAGNTPDGDHTEIHGVDADRVEAGNECSREHGAGAAGVTTYEDGSMHRLSGGAGEVERKLRSQFRVGDTANAVRSEETWGHRPEALISAW